MAFFHRLVLVGNVCVAHLYGDGRDGVAVMFVMNTDVL